MPFTKGFKNQHELEFHFRKHGAEFGAMDKDAYLAMAGRFLGGPRSAATLECVRPWSQDRVRYDTATEEFGVIGRDGTIKTYFRPDPAIHGRPSNLDYYRQECRRRRE